MKVPKCFECGYPTLDTYLVVPGGKGKLPLCHLCQDKLPKAPKNPFELIIDEHERSEGRTGNLGGRPRQWSDLTSEQAKMLLDRGLGVSAIANQLGFSYATTWKYLRKLRR